MPSSRLIDPVTNRFGPHSSVPNAHKDDLGALFDLDEDSADPTIHERWDIGTLQLRPESTFGLTQVCRALRAETLDTAYGSNVSVLPGGGTASSWTRKMTTEWLASLPEGALEMLVVDLDGELTRNSSVEQDEAHLRCLAFVQIKFRSAEASGERMHRSKGYAFFRNGIA
ncbi:hypothetical protein CERZMDRAFT_92391 [Cercospora zeae-maydis SCOH1-5]|uniref:Uncharacterized protein n=1 Tax=Cercospora zeae-maydis SCOH1-5 TaxID=717836 RepID=A0A6A6FWH4_9PEZI|nr:hypothetical protein CERZMDRAFT_92391 [Cercospora zeae-maydis SCOH1-5]